jgi:hypothetical protein
MTLSVGPDRVPGCPGEHARDRIIAQPPDTFHVKPGARPDGHPVRKARQPDVALRADAAPRITRRRDGRARRGAEAFDAHEEACDVGAAARFYRCRARRPT